MPAGERKAPEAIVGGDKVRVLVVEDDPDISAMREYALSNADWQAVAVSDCQCALQELAGTAPNLVLLDWMLPDMSGIASSNTSPLIAI